VFQSYFTKASKVLLTATYRRAYFRSISILVPPDWPETGHSYETDSIHSYSQAHIVVDRPNSMYGDKPYVVQPGGCGDPGLYLHLTPEYVSKVFVAEQYGPVGTNTCYGSQQCDVDILY